MLSVTVVPVGVLLTNCYIVGSRDDGEGMIIDPGDEAEKIAAAVKTAGLKIKLIVNTHGHYDHIGANEELRARYGAELLIHRDDAAMLADPWLNLSGRPERDAVEEPPADRLLDDCDRVRVGNVEFTVLHTPGHTRGCICLLGEDMIFTGDTLFAGSAGRTDLPGGSDAQLMASLKQKLQPLPSHLRVYPGHGPATTMEVEKRENPFMRPDFSE